MSYEGYTEYICPVGHYYTVDSMASYGGFATDAEYYSCMACPTCHTWPAAYAHSVDETNGYDDADQNSCNAPREMVSCFDLQVEDHRGNRYMVRDPRFAPAKGAEFVWYKVDR